MLSQLAAAVVKQEGGDNDFLARVRADPYFEPIINHLDDLLDPKTFIGRASQQVLASILTNLYPSQFRILQGYSSFQAISPKKGG